MEVGGQECRGLKKGVHVHETEWGGTFVSGSRSRSRA